MGQSKDGGYMKQKTVTPEQEGFLNKILGGQGGAGQDIYKQALQGISSFLPGGEGFDPIAAQARKGFQQQTMPQIMSAMGTDARGSSSLNQAMSSAGAGLEGQLASQRAQMMMPAAFNAVGMGQTAAQNPMFAYQQKQMPFWQQMMLGGVGAGGQIGGGMASAGMFNNLFSQAQRPQTGQMYSPKYGYMPAD